MKKLLALVLVLGVASLANAGFVITGPAEIVVGSSAAYTVTVTDTLNIADGLLSVTGPGSISGLAIVATPRDTTLDIINGLEFGVVSSSATAALAGNLVTFNLKGDALGTAVLSAAATDASGGSYDMQFNLVSPATGTLQVRIIPEPITLALLALGGLALRRRHA